jgi:hypothetical protein
MSMVGQIRSEIFTVAYQQKMIEAKEFDTKKDAKLKDSVSLSGRRRIDTTEDKNSAVLKKMVEERQDSRNDLILRVKTQISSQNYSFDERIDAVSSNIIYSMFA